MRVRPMYHDIVRKYQKVTEYFAVISVHKGLISGLFTAKGILVLWLSSFASLLTRHIQMCTQNIHRCWWVDSQGLFND